MPTTRIDYVTALIREIDRRFPSNGITDHAVTWESVEGIGDVLVVLVSVGDHVWPHRINPADLSDDSAETAEKIVSQFRGRIDMEPEKLVRFRRGETSTPRNADLRTAIGTFFYEFEGEWGVCAVMSSSIRTAPDHWRAPDVAVFENKKDEVPLAVFEVGDGDQAMMRALEEYEAIGVQQIWMVDPDGGSFTRYLPGGSLSFNEANFSQGRIEFDLAEIAAHLQWGREKK
jgi:hypothetical protein